MAQRQWRFEHRTGTCCVVYLIYASGNGDQVNFPVHKMYKPFFSYEGHHGLPALFTCHGHDCGPDAASPPTTRLPTDNSLATGGTLYRAL